MIDSHGHIFDKKYNQDRRQVINRAIENGVTQLLQVACSLEECHTVLALAEQQTGIYAALGVHPHYADTVNEQVLDQIQALTSHEKVVAWGEMGLDFYYDNSPRDIQKQAFRLQMARAQQCNLPIVIHTRDAEPETLEILQAHPVEKGGHIHCFTGSKEMAASLVEMGFHIGFTGIITFKKAQALRDVVAQTPLERILIETDSPYLAPTPHRGKRNEPAFVVEVAKKVAEIHQVDLEEVAQKTDENFFQVYGRPGLVWQSLKVA